MNAFEKINYSFKKQITTEMGGDIKSLQTIMGHTSVKTTMIYLKMSEQRQQNLMENFDALLY
ncbi:MAG: hypothetical protein IE931_06815 [Sphingobacteriales bacterium]|nr:hypothetical protein [Sphingobacteriales bacterium]